MLTTKFLSGAIEVSMEDVARVNCEISKEFECQLKDLIEKTERLILDLKGVRFIDTSGFQALKNAKQKAEGKCIIIKNANQDIVELFKLVDMEQEFQFSEN